LKALLGVRFSTLDGVLLSACLLGDLRRVLEGDLLIMLDLEFDFTKMGFFYFYVSSRLVLLLEFEVVFSTFGGSLLSVLVLNSSSLELR